MQINLERTYGKHFGRTARQTKNQGYRISVSFILGYLAAGDIAKSTVEHFPDFNETHVEQKVKIVYVSLQ